MSHHAHAIVIGGGFAGVAAACALRDRGANVTLLDAHEALGGRARSDDLDGVPLDTGAQLISAAYTRTVRLLDAAGDAGVQPARGVDMFVADGARYPLQFGSVRSLLAFGGLGGAEKLRLAGAILPALAAHHRALDADATHVVPAHDAQDARSFMVAHAGARAADIIVEPPLNGFWAVRGRETALSFYLMLSRYGSGGHVLEPARGWTTALERALHDVTVEHRARAAGIRRAATGLEVVGEDGRVWNADGVVLATGPRSAAAILAPLDAPAATAWLRGVPLRLTWTVALRLDCALPHDAFGVFPDAARARATAACAVYGPRARTGSAGGDVVLAWPTPAAVGALRDSGASDIVRAMLPDIEALLPETRGHVTRARVYRFDEGSPIPAPGFAADRARGRALLDALHPALALAGDYLAAPLIEGAVASGERAASRLADSLRLGSPP